MKYQTLSKLIPMAVVLLTLPSLHAQQVVADELLNPGMEDGLENWKVTAEDGGKSTVTPEAARSGKLGLHVQDEDPDSGSDCQSNLIPASPGETWTAKCKARIVNGANIGFYVRFFDAKFKLLTTKDLENENIVVVPDKQFDWDDLTVSGEAPEGTAYVGIWIRSFTQSIATGQFDDFSLSQNAP